MLKRLTTGAMAAMLAASTAFVMPARALDDAQKEEMGAFVREYLLANPEILQEMQTALQTKQEAEAAEKAKAAIVANRDALTAAPEDIVLGNPEGDVTIVEFFDYNCGYCKHALQDMNAIIEGDDQVRFVLKEFPILGPDSLAAHRVAMSFRKLMPDKYGEFHRTLLGSEGRATEDSAMELAVKLGAEEAEVRTGMEDPAISDSIKQAYSLADQLGINGTPSYIVGDEAVFGALGADVLEEKVANLRSCNSTVC
ncbi:MAG: disulfide bond formation protein DsbA [Rhizobiales bacterium]|nr:disulfide bond formation protein DsbA [Hyphomicrobiales bacterium]MBA69706.1 disulfide bond formation protein DsbA [Hyphomicrobiales bacterium]